MNKESSYRQILKSTTIFGGSQIVIILTAIIRTKIIAILLGPAGVGIIGIYQSIIDMMRSSFSVGMDTVGIKEIAEAETKEEKTSFLKTISRFNKWFSWTAIAGAIFCVILCYPISLWTFESTTYAPPIAVLSLCVFLAVLTTGRSTVLQGMRKIPEIAKAGIWSSIGGLIVSIPIYFLWGLNGIIPAFIITGILSFICIEFYYKRQEIQKINIPSKEALNAGLNILKLGIYIVLAGSISTISMFFVKAYITRTETVEAAGLFQAVWSITNIYLALILRSMGADFFPRLSAIADQRSKTKALVNEQTYIALIITPPIIIGTLLLSDLVLAILYSGKFSEANTLLCWQVAGSFFKILSWPIAFIMLAKSKTFVFFVTEAAFYAVYLGSALLLYPHWGLDAFGVGYLIAYISYLLLVFIIGNRLSGFRWDRNVVRMIIINLAMISITFYFAVYSHNYRYIGIILFSISLIYAYINLKRIVDPKDLIKRLGKK